MSKKITLFAMPAQAQTVDEFLATGDEALNAFDHKVALETYTLVLKQDSSNCAALWKIARAHIDLGEMAEKDA